MKTNKLLLLVAALCVMLVAGEISAQNFENNGAGQYNATCGAIVKMKYVNAGVSGQFTGTNKLGTSTSNVIQGVVEWSAIANDQQVQPLYYTHMALSGGNKTVLDGVRIFGSAGCTGFTGYEDLATYPFFILSGTHVFQGRFHYSGGAQTIYPLGSTPGGTNVYNTLEFNGIAAGSTKTIRPGETVRVLDLAGSDGDAPLLINGTLTLGTGQSVFFQTVTMDNTGAVLNVSTGPAGRTGLIWVNVNNGTINIPTGSSLVNVAPNGLLAFGDSPNASMNLGSGQVLEINGAMTNAYVAGTNLNFDCASIVNYNGTMDPQNIMQTTATNPYGILNLSAGMKAAAGDIYLCSNFTLDEGYLTMANDTFHMLSPTATAIYGGGTGREEVIGAFERTISQSATGVYTFNNRYTLATLTSTTTATSPSSMTFTVAPNSTAFSQYVAATDVKRSIAFAYSGNTAEIDETLALRVGYLQSELPIPPTTDQSTIRMWEANAAGIEKLTSGTGYNRVAAASSNLGYIELSKVSSIASTVLPNGLGNFASSNNIVLRSGPTTFYTVQAGRWTNPNTWDEGARPTANDDAEIRHMVYAGIKAPASGLWGTPGADAGENATENRYPENSAYPGGVAAANRITIASATTLGAETPSLMIGNEDNGPGYVFKTNYVPTLATEYSFVNNNAASPILDFVPAGGAVVKNNTSGQFNGLWLTGITAPTTGGLSILGTYNLQNNGGTVNNEGIIVVAE